MQKEDTWQVEKKLKKSWEKVEKKWKKVEKKLKKSWEKVESNNDTK